MPSVQKARTPILNGGEAYTNMSTVFADLAHTNATTDALDGIGGQHSTHPTDSHPPLESRLESLHVSWSEVTTAALTVSPLPPAAEIIDDVEQLEQKLSDTYQEFLAGQDRSLSESTDLPDVISAT